MAIELFDTNLKNRKDLKDRKSVYFWSTQWSLKFQKLENELIIAIKQRVHLGAFLQCSNSSLANQYGVYRIKTKL